MHQFQDVKNFVKVPTHARYRLAYLGSLVGRMSSLEWSILKTINRLRIERTDKLLEELKTLWKYRRMLQDDARLTNFKKRYGSWHYKKKNEEENNASNTDAD